MHNSAAHPFGRNGWVAAAPVICLILAMMPRSMSVVAPLFMLAALVAGNCGLIANPVSIQAPAEPLGWIRPPGELAFWSLALLALWALMSAAWSPVPAAGAPKALYLGLLVALLYAAVRLPLAVDDGVRDSAARVFVTTMCLLGILLAVEVATGEVVNRWILTHFEFLRPNTPKHIHVADGVVVGRTEAELNRRIALLSVLFWPAITMANFWLASERQRMRVSDAAAIGTASNGVSDLLRRPLLMAGGIGAILAIAASGHQSSQTALVVGIVVFALARLMPRVAILAVGTAWLTATLLIVPLALVAYKSGLHESPWLFHSARHRIVIWHETAKLVPNAPLLGIGADATPAVTRNLEAASPAQQSREFAISTGRHAHNFFLQIWFELGGVGAALMLVTGLLTLAAIWMLPAAVRAMATAHFAAMATLLASSYGVWQMWLQATLAASAFVMILGLSYYHAPSPDHAPGRWR